MRFHDVEMVGQFSVEQHSTTPTTADYRVGAIFYNTSDNKLYYRLVGGTWQTLEASAIGVDALLQDGSRPLTASWVADPLNNGYVITNYQFASSAPIGVPPATAISTTRVDNWNSHYLNGVQEGQFLRNDTFANNTVQGFDGTKLALKATANDVSANQGLLVIKDNNDNPLISLQADGAIFISDTDNYGSYLSVSPGGQLNVYSDVGVRVQSFAGYFHVGSNALYVDTSAGRVAVGTSTGLSVDFEVQNAGTIARNSVRFVSPDVTSPWNGGTHVLVGCAVPGNDAEAGTYSLFKAGVGAGYSEEAFVILGNKKIGFGTFSPAAQFNFSSTGLASDGSADLLVTGSGTRGAGLQLQASGSGGKTYTLLSSASGFGLGGGKFSIFDKTVSSHRLVVDTNGHIGINTQTPDATAYLDVNGQVRIRGGSPAVGKVLTPDANGLASWGTLASLGAPTGTGTSGRVVYWSGTTTQAGSGNFTWNNSSNILGVTGSITGSYGVFGGTVLNGNEPIEVQGSTAGVSLYDRTGGLAYRWSIYATGSASTKLRFWRGADKATLDTSGNMVLNGSLTSVGVISTTSTSTAGSFTASSTGVGVYGTTASGASAIQARHSGSTNNVLRVERHNASGDADIVFATSTSDTNRWVLGVDQSASNRFKLASGSALGTNDAFVVDLTTLRMAVGPTTPEFALDINTLTSGFTDGGIVARGTYGAGASLTTAGAGTRFIWYPKKAAFRAGVVGGTQWNDANIGDGSTSFGVDSIASGLASFSAGYTAAATGDSAVALGGSMNATNTSSAALGGAGCTASGLYSTTVGGLGNAASGNYSLAMGRTAYALNPGSLVWADSNSATFSSSDDNQARFRVAGGFDMHFYDGGAGVGLRLLNSDTDAPVGVAGVVGTFFDVVPLSNVGGLGRGGARIRAYAGGSGAAATEALQILGVAETGATGSDSSAVAPVELNGYKQSGGATVTLSGTENIVVIRSGAPASETSKFIFKHDGSLLADGAVTGSAFDAYDDLELLRAVEIRLARNSTYKGRVDEEFVSLLDRYGEAMKSEGLVSGEPGKSVFINLTRMTMLFAGAIRQLDTQVSQLRQVLSANGLNPDILLA